MNSFLIKPKIATPLPGPSNPSNVNSKPAVGSTDDSSKTVQLLRDTGASQSLIAQNVLADVDTRDLGEVVLLQGIQHTFFSPYHPQSQGGLERFHQTLKQMLKTTGETYPRNWDENLPFVLFAAREGLQGSLGCSPFELVFGHQVRGPLKMPQVKLMGDVSVHQSGWYLSEVKNKLCRARELAKEHLEQTQQAMKQRYDKKFRAKLRSFADGDLVLVLKPCFGTSMSHKFEGPYQVVEKVGDLTYKIFNPTLSEHIMNVHINRLKAYVGPEMVARFSREELSSEENCSEENDVNIQLLSSSSNGREMLCHLQEEQRDEFQIALTYYAREVTAFVTPDGAYEFNVIPFGVRNAAATFQRLMNFLLKDVPDCAKAYLDDIVLYIAAPLTNLLRKQVKFKWTKECQNSFQNLKGILSTSPVLASSQFGKPFILHIDASDVGIGAELIQVGLDNIEHPVYYYSRKFNSAQKNYSVVEKEALGLILSIKKFEIYLSGNKVLVFTDHNPLIFINMMKIRNQRILRWSLFLQEFNVEIKHIPSRQNVTADALSRSFAYDVS
ncbi:uncharacterized protein [Procambarus clarkii]|uniref:uncharacterized protein n=1 Tax=Procambarus clarkii TaxID=6728 RepID=UPI003742FACD